MSASDDTRADAPPPDRRQLAAAAGWSLLFAVPALVVFADHGFGLDGPDLFVAATLIGLFAAVVVLPARGAALGIGALVATWLFGYALYAKVPDWIELPMPVSEAVGGAALFMTSYVDQQVAGVLLVLAVLAAGIVLAVLTARVDQPAGEGGEAHAERTAGAKARSGWRRPHVMAIGIVALVAVTLLPDLNTALIEGSRGPLPAGWDEANVLSWQAFQQRGLTPMRDFWYPYGGQWILADFPAGPAVSFVWYGCVLAAAAWSLWRLARPTPVRLALCLLVIVAIGNLFAIDLADDPELAVRELTPSFVWRYLPALVVAVCYAAVGPLRHLRPTLGHVVFGATCAAVGIIEADILVAGLGGAAFIAVGELVFDPALRAWRSLRAALVDLLPVLAGLALVLAFWALTDSLAENVRWFTSARAVSASSANAQDLEGSLVGLRADPSLVTLLVTIPGLTLAVAFLQRRFGGARGVVSSRLLFAAAGISTVLLAKHLVRPQGPLLLFIPLVALLWTAILHWRPLPLRAAIAAGLFAGAALGMLQANASVTPTEYLGRALSTPVRAVADLRLVLDRGRIRAAGNGRFAAERFNAIPEKPAIADKLTGELTGTGNDRFATLGDAQILYVLFGQDPPGHIALYDASPVAEQRRWIDTVRERNTRLLVWRRDLYLDGITYPLRNPLVFAYAIANYVPQRLDNPMDLLRLRKPGERMDETFWTNRLGYEVSLGGIPSYSRGDDLDRCDSGPDCAPYAIVTGPVAKTGEKITVSIGGVSYHVSFATRKGVDSYAIRLDRLWFWPFTDGARRLSVSAPGWKVQRAGVKAGDDLY